VTTDRAPSLTGREAGFVPLFIQHVGHSLTHFHCTVHKEALCATAGLKEHEVIKTVIKVTNYISAHTLKNRQFQDFF
jgi:hypothetical protein